MHSADAGYVKLGAGQKGTIPIQELFTPESRLSGKKVMVASTLDKFLKAEVVKSARIQVMTADGVFHDVKSMKLMENRIIGCRETHRIVIEVIRN